MTDRSFQRANDESRARLARMTAGLTPTQLLTDLGEGWTAASAAWRDFRIVSMSCGV